MRSRRVRLFPLLGCLIGLSGCIGVSVQYEGNPIPPESLEKIEVGKTTRAEVLDILGSPLVIDRADITGLAEQVLARYQGEKLALQIDPSLFNDVYVYERRQIDRFVLFLGVFNYASSDERADRLSIFFDKQGKVLGLGWTPGTEDL